MLRAIYVIDQISDIIIIILMEWYVIPSPEAPIRENDVVCITMTTIVKQRRRRPRVLTFFLKVSFPNGGSIMAEEEKLKVRDLTRIHP